MRDLSKLSIICSVKLDSADRLRNVTILLRYFRTFFVNYELILVEQGSEQTALADLANGTPGIIHHFLRSDNCHYKTRNLNLAVGLSTREFLLMCDVDALLPPDAIIAGLEKLSASASFVYPYNG